MAERESFRALRVGVLLLAALGALAGVIWTLGESSQLWRPRVEFRVLFSNVQGLSRGAPVSVAGYDIGKVERLALLEDITAGLVEVTISVERANRRYIRTDTRARLKSLGLLTGARYIDLTSGSAEADELTPGSNIEAIQPPNLDDLLEQGESVADNLVVLTTSMRQIVQKLGHGEGLIGALISDSEDGREITADVRGAVAGLRAITEKANQGTGLAATLLNDEQPAADLRRSLNSLARAVEGLERGDGAVPRLLRDGAFADRLIANLDEASLRMRDFATRLDNDHGLLARLTDDEKLADEIMRNLEDTSEAVARVTRRIDAGEGSLGRLIHDETLYRGMNDILAGASKSTLTRWFVGRSQKLGADERLRQQPRERPPTAGPVP